MTPVAERALVLFSGGQDSTTCLADALDRYQTVETIGFHYGQRHAIEMECRGRIRDRLAALKPAWRDRLGEDFVIDITALRDISASSLTQDIAFEMEREGLPNTFVPGRNLIFLTFAAALAYRRGVRHIVTGVCETDYSGYPDCRDDTIKAMQVALNLGMERRFVLHTPLMWIDKAETWRMTERIGGQPLVDIVREETHSCYLGNRTTGHEWGFGCGTCPACELRAEGYRRYRAS